MSNNIVSSNRWNINCSCELSIVLHVDVKKMEKMTERFVVWVFIVPPSLITKIVAGLTEEFDVRLMSWWGLKSGQRRQSRRHRYCGK